MAEVHLICILSLPMLLTVALEYECKYEYEHDRPVANWNPFSCISLMLFSLRFSVIRFRYFANESLTISVMLFWDKSKPTMLTLQLSTVYIPRRGISVSDTASKSLYRLAFYSCIW
jgi:lipid-A-disaccharide synthase-like uncharacterized protein